MLHNEPVIGFIGIKRIDDVVAVHPAFPESVLVVTDGVRISHQIQPKDGQAFPEMRRFKKIVNES